MAAATQTLPQKESGIFKKIVRCYECKQYKNGLKFAKQILSNQKFADHGETLAMKGLILNCMGRKEEAYEHVRRGLKNDIKSHVCWHVYGLLQRSDKKYDEAIKCYRNALKWDKENVQILRDLSLLQIQMRDLEGFRDTRYQLLKVRPAQRSSWVGYALSYHLLRDYDMALKVMVEYRKTQSKPQKTPDYEFSEMILYEVQLMRESGQQEKALAHLEGYRQFVSDDLSYAETKAEILLDRGDRASAELLYHDLLIRNPENYSYYESLEKCLDLTSEGDRLKLYEILREEFPRSHVCKRIPLRFVTGETFQRLLDDHLQPSLHKGVPSLFMGLKSLYSDPHKVDIIGSTTLGYLDSLQHHQKFKEDSDAALEPPTAELWTLFFLAQHFDQIGEHKRALEYIDMAISHTPTHIELYMLKSKIYKHAGDLEEAAQWMDEARTMDTADRFVNCKCVKYLLRINKIEQAIETAGLFTREGLPTLQTLDEMQCMWFQTELAHAYRRVGQLGEALVKYHEIDRHFSDIIDDQFDFHTYCMRKMTLRPYVGVLRLEDVIKEHRFYFKAALEAIELYIHLHDNPSARSAGNQVNENQDDKDMENLSASERRKLHRKQRKAQAKAQARAEAKALEERKENRPQGKSADDDRKVGDELRPKLDPKALVSKENPLDEAIKFLVPLQSFCRGKIETHLSAYAIHSRRGKDGKGKFLLMLQALKRAHAMEPSNPRLHTQLVDFQLRLKEEHSFPAPMKVVIETTVPKLTNEQTPEQLNQEFLARHSCSLEHLIAGAQTLYRLGHNSQDAIRAVTGLSDPLKDVSVKQCSRVLHLLNNATFGNCNDATLSYKSRCHELFPMATAFKPSRPQAKLDPQIPMASANGNNAGCDSACSKA